MISRNVGVEEVACRSMYHRGEKLRRSYFDREAKKGRCPSVIAILRRNGRFDAVSRVGPGAEFTWRRLDVHQVNLLLERHSPSLVVYQGTQLPRFVLNTARRLRHLVYRPFGCAILSPIGSEERLASLALRGMQLLLSLSAALERLETNSSIHVEAPSIERGSIVEALLTFTDDIDEEIRLADATLDSLSTFWRRDEPLVLNVVAEERALGRLERDLIRVPNVQLYFSGTQRGDKSRRGTGELHRVADGRSEYALCLRPGDFLASRITNRTFSLAAQTAGLPKTAPREGEVACGRPTNFVVEAREAVGGIERCHTRGTFDVEPIGGPFVVSRRFVRMLLASMPAILRMENVSEWEIVDSCVHIFSSTSQPNLRIIGNLAELEEIAKKSKSELWNYEGPPIFVSLPFASHDVEAVVALLYQLLPQ